jgi:hypothetical protein
MQIRISTWALALVILSLSPIARAQEYPPSQEPRPGVGQMAAMQAQLDELRAQHQALLDKIAALDARTNQPREEPSAPKHTVTFQAAPGRGLVLTVGDAFSISLRPRVQVRDTVIIEDGKPTTNEINVKTIRLWIMGHMLTKDLQYGIQLAFGGADLDRDTPSPIMDAYVDYLRLRDLHIRIGQYFVPLDRARTTFEYAMQLPDRGQMVTELALDRDVGITLSSSDLFGSHGIVGYALGIYGGEGKNHLGGAGVGFLYVGRIIITPFGPFDDYLEGDVERIKKPRLAIGIGGAYNQSTNRQRSNVGTTLTLGTFDYGHAAADLVFKYGGFALMAEVLYRQSRQGSLSAMVNGAEVREWSRSAIGYLVQAGMMVHKRVELVGRYDDLRALGQTDPALIALAAATGKEINGGINVFVNGHAFKFQLDYQYLFGDSIHTGRHGMHLQLEASF